MLDNDMDATSFPLKPKLHFGSLVHHLKIVVRLYLVGYIFCIIDYHICLDIFDRINIMYYRLSYVFGGALPLKTLILYIHWPRGTMQYNQTSIHNLFFQHGNQSLGFFRFRVGFDTQSLPLPSTTSPPGRSISTPPRAVPLFRRGSY
jgi:hypothetical protein